LTLASLRKRLRTPTAASSFTFRSRFRFQQRKPSGSFTIRDHSGRLAITTSSLPPDRGDRLHKATTLAATGGTPPYTWSARPSRPLRSSAWSSPGVISVPLPPELLRYRAANRFGARQPPSLIASYVAAAYGALSILPRHRSPTGGRCVLPRSFAATGGLLLPVVCFHRHGAHGSHPECSTGSLTGTPHGGRTFNFTIRVVDAQRRATQAFTMKDQSGALVISRRVRCPVGTVGTPTQLPPSLRPADAADAWSVAFRRLPAASRSAPPASFRHACRRRNLLRYLKVD